MSFYKLLFYVPHEQKDYVKESLFKMGAGKYENYDKCCWEIEGMGQFRPLSGSNPFIGSEGEVEKVPEFRVEMICKKEIIKEVLEELMRVHPYEEPAYDVAEILTIDDF